MKGDIKERLAEMAKEFGATNFEETLEEMSSAEEKEASQAPKQHVKRLTSAEQNAEFQVYQGTSCGVNENQHKCLHEVHAPISKLKEGSYPWEFEGQLLISSRNMLSFMEPECSFLFFQKPVIEIYPESILSRSHI
jgi:hypothetical protein